MCPSTDGINYSASIASCFLSVSSHIKLLEQRQGDLSRENCPFAFLYKAGLNWIYVLIEQVEGPS